VVGGERTGFRIQDTGFGIQEMKEQVPGVRGYQDSGVGIHDTGMSAAGAVIATRFGRPLAQCEAVPQIGIGL
jgi:hypothetical protein